MAEEKNVRQLHPASLAMDIQEAIKLAKEAIELYLSGRWRSEFGKARARKVKIYLDYISVQSYPNPLILPALLRALFGRGISYEYGRSKNLLQMIAKKWIKYEMFSRTRSGWDMQGPYQHEIYYSRLTFSVIPLNMLYTLKKFSLEIEGGFAFLRGYGDEVTIIRDYLQSFIDKLNERDKVVVVSLYTYFAESLINMTESDLEISKSWKKIEALAVPMRQQAVAYFGLFAKGVRQGNIGGQLQKSSICDPRISRVVLGLALGELPVVKRAQKNTVPAAEDGSLSGMSLL